MSNDKHAARPKSPSEIQLDGFLRDMETREGAEKWGKGAYEEAKRSGTIPPENNPNKSRK